MADPARAVEAVGSIHTIDRAGCRARARDRFGADRMGADYLSGYESSSP